MSFNKRLKQAMELRGFKQVDLVERTGIGKSSISQYLSGDYEAKQDNIFLLAKALDVDPAWLMGKNVPMYGTDYKKSKAKSSLIPLVGTIAAGTPILAEQNIEDYFNLDTSIKADFALRVKGDSMIDAGITEEDIAFIRKQENLENGEIGAILIEGEATLKKFYKRDGAIILQAENKAYEPMVYTNGDIRILGKLVAVLNIRD